MLYRELRQWRDICEHLDSLWYKFIDADQTRFSFLYPSYREYRQELWSLYMVQFVQWGPHPHTFYCSRRSARAYRKIVGWRLAPDWTTKIDFFEKIVLLGYSPDDLPQPWKQAIWQAFFKRRETEILREQEYQEYRERELKRFQALQTGECPLGLRCQDMTGAFHSQDCENFTQCRQWRSHL